MTDDIRMVIHISTIWVFANQDVLGSAARCLREIKQQVCGLSTNLDILLTDCQKPAKLHQLPKYCYTVISSRAFDKTTHLILMCNLKAVHCTWAQISEHPLDNRP